MRFPDYPFTSKYADISGFNMHYLDEGPSNAEPVVMLHGNPSWSFYYRKLISGLKDTYRCIAPDHIGMGLSDRPSANQYDFHFMQRVDDLSDFLDQIRIRDNITLVLHDWGGMIGMLFASQNPGRVKRLVILNTAAFHLPQDKRLPWSLRLGRVPLMNSLLIQGLNLFSRGGVKHCVSTPMDPEVASAYLSPYDSWHRRLAVRKFVEDIPLKLQDRGYDMITKVSHNDPAIKSIPKIICWGMQDFVFDETFLNEWRLRYPEAQVHQFEHAGHYVLEDAAGDIIPLLRTFLKNNPL